METKKFLFEANRNCSLPAWLAMDSGNYDNQKFRAVRHGLSSFDVFSTNIFSTDKGLKIFPCA